MLGGFELTLAPNIEAVFSTRKSLALLAYLATTPDRRRSRAQIADLLWSGTDETRARVSLRQTLSRLRKSLEPGCAACLISDGDTLRISPLAMDIDVRAFEELSMADSLSARERAVDLYAGDFLEGISFGDQGFEDWVSRQRTRLRDRAFTTMSALLDSYLEGGQNEQGISIARRLVAIDPFHEFAHRALMRCYARAGRRQAALAQYEQCRQLLGDELGVLPGPETQALYQRIYDGNRNAGIEVHGTDDRSRDSVDSRSARTPLAGRRIELQLLSSVLENCADTSRGQAVYLRGEAGIGKTRVTEELARLAMEKGFKQHRVQVLDFGAGRLNDPLYSTVCSLLGVANQAELSLRASYVERAIDDALLRDDDRVFINDLLELPQSAPLRSAYDAMDETTRLRGKRMVVTQLLVALSRQHPMLLVFEDIQWAQSQFLHDLAALISTVAKSRAVLVGTARKEDDPLDRAWHGSIRGSPMITIDLGALDESECRELASHYVDPGLSFARNCIARADGNPLFLEQLLRSGEDPRARDVPETIRGIVLYRMEQLAPNDRAAALAASVAGQRFSLDLLRHLLERPDYDCASLIDNHLVRSDGGELVFGHALLRDAVYDSLKVSHRKSLHRRAADWYANVDPILRAEHLDRAHDAGAANAYLHAALAQNRLYRCERALSLVERGLDLATRQVEVFELLDMKGVLQRNLGETDACVETFQQALDMAVDDQHRCRAWIGLAAGLRLSNRSQPAFEYLANAERVATSNDLDKALAMIHRIRGNLYFPRGELENCLAEHERSRHHARRAGSAEDEARALGGLADVEYARGRMRSALRYYEACIERCREYGFGRVEFAHLSMLASTLRYLNRLEEALQVAMQAIVGAVKVGHRRAESLARGVAAMTLYEMDDLGQARELSDAATSIARQIKSQSLESMWLLTSAKLHRSEGDNRRAIDAARNALALSRNAGMTFIGPAVLSTVALLTDDPQESRAALEEGELLLSNGCVAQCHFWFYRDAIEINLNARAWQGVSVNVGQLADFTKHESVPWAEFVIERAQLLADVGNGGRSDSLLDSANGLVAKARTHKMLALLPQILDIQQQLQMQRLSAGEE